MRGFRWLLSLALLGVWGCGDSPARESDSGTTTPLTTKDVCDQACVALMNCGVLVDSTCSTNCQAGTSSYIDCVWAVKNDCNSIALCSFAAVCGTGPSGAATCAQTASCEGSCNVSNPTAACGCACIGAMEPSKAINLLINNTCAAARCPQYCTAGAAFDGALCNQCFAQVCQDKSSQCTSN